MNNAINFVQGNELLDALPPDVVAGLCSKLQPVELKVGETLYAAGEPLKHAYFPVTAVVSLFSPLEAGVGAEVAAVGREGIVGICSFMGTAKAMSSAVVQHTGMALRISANDVAELARTVEPAMRQLLGYAQVLFTNMAQTSACRTHHSIQEQLCSWLLQHLDRQQGDDLYVTQERIAGMLGSRRESITESALRLQRQGVIQYQRGLIRVLDRTALEDQCCECYNITNRAFQQLRVVKDEQSSCVATTTIRTIPWAGSVDPEGQLPEQSLRRVQAKGASRGVQAFS